MVVLCQGNGPHPNQVELLIPCCGEWYWYWCFAVQSRALEPYATGPLYLQVDGEVDELAVAADQRLEAVLVSILLQGVVQQQ